MFRKSLIRDGACALIALAGVAACSRPADAQHTGVDPYPFGQSRRIPGQEPFSPAQGLVVSRRPGEPGILVPMSREAAVMAAGAAAIAGLVIDQVVPIDVYPRSPGTAAARIRSGPVPGLAAPPAGMDFYQGGSPWNEGRISAADRDDCTRAVRQEAARHTGFGNVVPVYVEPGAAEPESLVGTFSAGNTAWSFACEAGRAILHRLR